VEGEAVRSTRGVKPLRQEREKVGSELEQVSA
jgi:hypothetical protein